MLSSMHNYTYFSSLKHFWLGFFTFVHLLNAYCYKKLQLTLSLAVPMSVLSLSLSPSLSLSLSLSISLYRFLYTYLLLAIMSLINLKSSQNLKGSFFLPLTEARVGGKGEASGKYEARKNIFFTERSSDFQHCSCFPLKASEVFISVKFSITFLHSLDDYEEI